MPPSLEQVHEEAVEQYFSKIDDPQWEDLNLPPRHSHGRNIESKLCLQSWATVEQSLGGGRNNTSFQVWRVSADYR